MVGFLVRGTNWQETSCPPARRGGSKAQATSERERRAGRGEARGHREGLIFLIGRGRGTARWRVRAKNEPASSSFYRRPE